MIGGYENGMIRVWSIQSYSIVTLRGLLAKHLNSAAAAAAATTGDDNGSIGSGSAAAPPVFGGGTFGTGAMAISPISLLHEWMAHSSPLVSRKKNKNP